jgi:DNA mismatch endonuclease (patch repair protein)
MPKSNTAYWAMKFQANQLRDIQNLEALRALGWEVLQIWECELEDQESWVDRIEDFLRGRGV